MIERAAAARRAGLDSLTIGDRHAMGEPYYQNGPMLGRLLAEWGDLPAGCLYLVPLWHPVLMAEQIGTLAAIHTGPFIVQTGVGGGRQQFSAMGADLSTRGSRTEHQIRVVRRLLAGETVTDERLGITEATISPRPPEPVEWWIGASADVGIDRAARLGDAWYATPGLGLEAAAERLAVYHEACERHGVTPTRAALRHDVYVGESDAEALATTAPALQRGYRGIDPDTLVIGSPSTVAERFAAYGELGYTDIIVRQISVPQDRAVASIERLAEVRAAL
jgi:alkanesulfonate monooxygenase SsuD/methylene tetrahydromethanopterin reductase-like flavin-dependent oxidoreductase (luciferase family)